MMERDRLEGGIDRECNLPIDVKGGGVKFSRLCGVVSSISKLHQRET